MNGPYFERNLAALLTRALPEDAPSPEFRRRVALSVEVQLRAQSGPRGASAHQAAPGADRWQSLPRALALAAALLAAVLLARVWSPTTPSGGAEPGGPQHALGRDPAHTPAGAAVATAPPTDLSDAPLVADRSGVTGDAAAATLPVAPEESGPPQDSAGVGSEQAPEDRVKALDRVTGREGLTGERAPAAVDSAAGDSAAGDSAAGDSAAGDSAAGDSAAGRPPSAADGVSPGGASDPAAAAPPPPALWLALHAERPLSDLRVWIRREVDVPEVAEPTVHLLGDRAAAANGPAIVHVPLPADARVTVVVEAAGHAPWRATGLTANAADTALAVALTEGAPITGVVLDAATGAPVAGALVLVESALPHQVLERHGEGLAPLPHHAARTDVSGAFRIHHAPYGELVLRASHAGFAPAWSAVAGDAGASAEDPRLAPTLALGPGARVRGRVERRDGSPFAGAEVILSQLPGARRPGGSGAPMSYGAGIADADGVFEVAHLPPGAFVALCIGDLAEGALQPRMQHMVLRGSGTAEVDFLASDAARRGVALALRLQDMAGEPLADLALSLYDVHAGAVRNLRTDAAGRCEALGLARGLWAVCRAERGYRDQVVLGHVDLRAGASEREVELTVGAGVFRLVALGPGEARVSGGRLTLQREVAPGQFEFHATWALDRDGVASVEGLMPGRYRATIAGAALGLGHAHVAPFEHDGLESQERRVELPAGGALAVRVIEEATEGAVGAVVHLTDGSGRALALGIDARTDAGGMRVFPALAPGRYSVAVQAFDGREQRAEVEVLEGVEAQLAVRMP